MKKKTRNMLFGVLALVLLVVLVILRQTEIVNFPDPGLEAAIRNALEKPTEDIRDTAVETEASQLGYRRSADPHQELLNTPLDQHLVGSVSRGLKTLLSHRSASLLLRAQ